MTVSWLHNGIVVGPGDHPSTSAIPNGDWTYQTQVTLMVAPTAGDTFACSVQHVSLDEPLLEEWSELGGTGTPTRTSGSSPHPLSPSPHRVLTGPGLSPGLTVKVAVATVLMVLGLSFFGVGVYCYRGKPPAPGEWSRRDRDSGLGWGGTTGTVAWGDTDPPHPLYSLLQVTLPSPETPTPQVMAHPARPHPLSPRGTSPLLPPYVPFPPPPAGSI